MNNLEIDKSPRKIKNGINWPKPGYSYFGTIGVGFGLTAEKFERIQSLTYAQSEDLQKDTPPPKSESTLEETIDFSQMEYDFPVGFFSGAKKYLNGTLESVSRVIKRK